ncbi:hypothetical protein KOW79_022251 [Hemibagrus wyckioides]|uniref:Uncharacterized protein n=1 Tax=Hemibagrus wyckioides TaxID=337641 RepID=A0A9D3N237_9TELE|nr:hypothetical protein KOW79_022251 [Hemibagrus wyckioides]
MWEQGTTHGFQLRQAEPAETEESGHFLSFAKRSREVHRRSAVTVCLPARELHDSPSPSQYGEEFWEKILRYPSRKAESYDPWCGDPLTVFSREPAEMVWTGLRGGRNENLSVDTLPSPAQLMGRRKKRGRAQRGDAAQIQAAAVTQHIGELRRKQSAIEQMKKEKWWGSTLGYTSENSCSFDVGSSPETLWSPTHLNTSTDYPQVFGGCKEMMDLAPGGNPMMSFAVAGTARREAERSWDTPCLDTPYVDTPVMDMPYLDTPYLDTPCLSHAEFWGFPSIM